MTRKNKTILTYFVLLLLAAAIIASGRYIQSKNIWPAKKDYDEKLAELKADLTKASEAGPAQRKSANNKRKPIRSGST